MLSFFKRRAFLLLIGFLLIALFIWYAGPYFGFGDAHPLDSVFARLVCIGLVALAWAASGGLRWWRARRVSAQLARAVVQQAEPAERLSPDVAKLRERFEAAVASLSEGTGRSLYDLPWYAIIGAPGSGKTTALVNSGLQFPLEQRLGRNAIRGVGGTRDCDWWFTSDAVLLDTAGRYTTQDSDSTADAEGWREFLALLGRFRKRRPLNGIILTISAQDLLTHGDAGLDVHIDAVQRRLREFVAALPVRLPIYVMVTKCDMVAGFADFFEPLTQEERAQVWGVTFPYDESRSGGAAAALAAEFDDLMQRLNARLFARVDETRGVRRRGAVFAFPQQMAGLREPLTQFVNEVFATPALDGRVLLRGVYFTSGTQDGTQMDRLLGAIGRRFGVAPEVTAAPPGRGKAYFVERLLKDVIIAESGLAGVNRQVEKRAAVLQFAAYAAIVLAVAIGVTALSTSYANNRSYLERVTADVATLRRLPPVVSGTAVETLLPRLNAVAAVADSADRYRDQVPWGMRWGLYQGVALGNAARDAYGRELDSLLLPQFAARIRRHLTEPGIEPEWLYQYLKGYLMLGQPRRLDRGHLELLAEAEWPGREGSSEPTVATHVGRLLALRDGLRPIALDPVLVAQAQSTIRQASIPRIMYGWVQRHYRDDPRQLRWDIDAGVGLERVLRRRSGRRLSDPFPALYTKAVFKEVTTTGMAPFVKQFADESWVWGSERSLGSLASTAALTDQVTDLYERDYVRAWDDALNDLDIVPAMTVQQYTDALGLLIGPTSPLRGLLRMVVDQTTIIETAASTPGATPSVGARITQSAQDLLRSTRQKITGSTGAAPGTVVTSHFQPVHRVMAGSPAPIDAVFEQVRKIRDQLVRVGPQVGGSSPLTALTDQALMDLWRALRVDAGTLPAPLNTLVTRIAEHTVGTVSGVATGELEQRYQAIVADCRTRLAGRYPFGDVEEMALSDFTDLFGPGGVYDRFFSEHLAKLVDKSQQPWAWRPDSVHPSTAILAQFERVEQIRQMFFPAGGKTPKVPFMLSATGLDSAATFLYVWVDGQPLKIAPGQHLQKAVDWPGAQTGHVYVTFEDKVAAPVRVHEKSGPWALFRLIDETASPPAADNDRQTTLTVLSPQHRARVTVEAQSALTNPFGTREWRRFSCGS